MRPFHRPLAFFPPPSCNSFEQRMPWGSPRHPFARQYRPLFLRPPFGMSPEGFRLPSHMQAPPMFGPRGPTIPPHLMTEYNRQGKSPRQNDNISHGDSAKQFWCEPCDRGFNTKEMLDKHNSEHQKCGIDGCEFTAHGNVVTKHIQMQHRTGLYDKIRNINTPEDIENWIKERKKNYPTKENIEKKKAQRKECFDRGEKLQDDKGRFGNNRANNRDGKFKDRRNKHREMKGKETNKQFNNNKEPDTIAPHGKTPNNTFDSNKKKNMVIPKKEFKGCLIQEKTSHTEEDNYHNLKPFRGTSELVRNDLISDDKIIPVVNDLDIEDHEWQELESDKANSPKRLSVCNALSNLISAYDSSDDEPDEVCSKIDNKSTAVNSGNNNSLIIGKVSTTLSREICTVGSGNSENLNSVNKSNTDVSGPPTTVHGPMIQDIDSDGSGPEEVRIDKDQKELKVLNSNDELNDSSNINNLTNKRTRKRKHSSVVRNDSLGKKPNAGDMAFKDGLTKVEISKEKKVSFHQQQNFKKRLPKTLLEKLLENDIRNERNLVLQCIHFIVQNNFFQKTNEKDCENS